MNSHVLGAIFRRNFTAYFSSPTGYVFICLFMLASSAAAFLPHAFFNANLANLDQLNAYFPLIMLVFIPTITMSVWADERRQGTDELLLTIPATDIDVVMGKYLAALAIYCVALLFSFISNLWMLTIMGNPDWGLMFANYVGYFLVGAAMLATGMVGSFLTSNLTVAFVIGVMLNLPLVLMIYADTAITSTSTAMEFSRWSVAYRLGDFGRGVISLSSIAYFLSVTAVMLYLAVVLIGRRHWLGGRDGSSLIGHFMIRTLAIIIAAVGLVWLCSNHDLRADATAQRINTLTPKTAEVLGQLRVEERKELEKDQQELEKQKAKLAAPTDEGGKKELARLEKELKDAKSKLEYLSRPILIEAYVSRNMPEAYNAKRLELESKLREFEHLARGKLRVVLHQIDPQDEAVEQANTKYQIKPRTIVFRTHGAVSQDKVLLGAAFVHGTNREIVKFFELGVPVEYELLRSIAAVSQQKRKTLGLIDTQGGDMSRAFGDRDEGMLAELNKIYKVETITPSSKIELVDPKDPDKKNKYDVLLVVQPSSLGPQELPNVVEAIRSGIPTAVFEDPMPLWSSVAGTSQPRRAPQNPMMGQFQPPQELPKGDISQLWKLLGVTLHSGVFAADDAGSNPLAAMHGARGGGSEALLVWQDYNPYRQLREGQQLTNGFVFLRESTPGAEKTVFSETDPITKGLFEVLALYPGAINKQLDSGSLTFTPLLRTGTRSGTVRHKEVQEVFDEVMRPGFGEEPDMSELPFEMRTRENPQPDQYVIAARIQGKPAAASAFDPLTGAGSDASAKPTEQSINVVLVTDIDLLHSRFFRLRAQPDPDTQNQFQFQNVAFVLNILDDLAKNEQFLEVRKRREHHGTLTGFEKQAEKIRQQEEDVIETAVNQFKKARDQAEEAVKKITKDLTDEVEAAKRKNDASLYLAAQYKARMGILQASTKQEKEKVQAKQKRNKELEAAQERQQRQTHELETKYKMAAVLVPPIPPLILALCVFLYRRSQEKEGVAKSRLR